MNNARVCEMGTMRQLAASISDKVVTVTDQKGEGTTGKLTEGGIVFRWYGPEEKPWRTERILHAAAVWLGFGIK